MKILVERTPNHSSLSCLTAVTSFELFAFIIRKLKEKYQPTQFNKLQEISK